MEDEQGTGVEDEELNAGQTHYEEQTSPTNSSSTRPGRTKITTGGGQSETTSLYRSTPTTPGRVRFANLRGRGNRRKYMAAGIAAGLTVAMVGLLIHALVGSLMLLNLKHHIWDERRGVRYVRTFNKNATEMTAEKVTAEASGKTAAELERTPLGEEVKTWNPETTVKNMGSEVSYRFEYEGGRPVRVIFDGKPMAVDSPEFKNFFTMNRSSPEWQSFYKQLYSKTDQALLRDTGSYAIRSRVSKQVINSFHGKLFWWQRKGLEEKGKTDAEIIQDEQKRIFEEDEVRSRGAVTARDGPGGMKETENEALSKERACLANPTCAKEVSSGSKSLVEASGADGVVADFAKRVQHPPGISGVLARVLNPIFIAAVPICIIHDGSMSAVADFLRAQQAAGMAAFLGLASQVSQQARGDVTGEAVGGAIKVLGNISQTIPEKWARGEPTTTLTEPFAQAARYQNYTILYRLFGRVLIKVVKLIVQYICPILLNPAFLIGTTLLFLFNIFKNLVFEARTAAKIASIEARSVVSRVTARVIASLSLNTAQRKLLMNGAMRFALGIGGQYAAASVLEKAVRMAVMGEMGAFYDGSNINDATNKNPQPATGSQTRAPGFSSYFASLPHYFGIGVNDGSNPNAIIAEAPAPYVNQMDMGAMVYNNELDRQQNFGRPMTNAEALATQTIDKQWVIAQKNRRSFFQKHLALSQPDSTLARTIMGANQVIEHPSTIARFFGRLPHYIGSMFGLSQQAEAANEARTNGADTTNYNTIQWGWTREEIAKIDSDPSLRQPLVNARIVARVAPLIAAKYGPCYSKDTGDLQEVDITSPNAKYLSHNETTGEVDDRGLCNPHSLGMNNNEFGPMMVFRWRRDCSLQSTMTELRDIQRADGTVSLPRNCGVSAAGASASTSAAAATAAVQTPPPVAPSSVSVAGDASTPCDPRTKDIGIYTGYQNGSATQVRLCSIPNLPCSNAECHNGYGIKGADGHALVNSTVSKQFYDMVEAANAALPSSLHLSANSTFRTMANQQSLCPCDGVYVARPGYSNHQMGLAVDFDIKGISETHGSCNNLSGVCTASGHADWEWLSNNSKSFGLYQYVNEFWHFSPSGH